MKLLIASAALASVTGMRAPAAQNTRPGPPGMVAPAAQNARPAAQNARLRVGGSAPGAGMGAPPPGTAAGARYAQEKWGNAPYDQAPPPEYAPASVSEKVDSLLNELGYAEAQGPLDQKVAMAVKELGMEKEVASMKMVEKVDACLATLGMIVASRSIEGEPGQGYDQGAQFAGAPGPYGGPMRGGRDPYSNYFSNSRAVNDGSVTASSGGACYGRGTYDPYQAVGETWNAYADGAGRRAFRAPAMSSVKKRCMGVVAAAPTEPGGAVSAMKVVRVADNAQTPATRA
ncbi:hypothetical protein JL722_3918 [Aureococcus anophagefferens]|nr:hypothetical protein JL722_3918 [Aureococcus anophagefferens]